MHRPMTTLIPTLLFCLIFSFVASAHDEENGKPLGQTVVLTFTFNNSDAKISTATTDFAIESSTQEIENYEDGSNQSFVKIDLTGTVTQGKRKGSWLVQVRGSVRKSELENYEDGSANSESELSVDASVNLRPGDQKVLVTDWHQKVLVTLNIYDDE